MEKSEKKVSVTGGSGFIGQHLMRRLAKSNIDAWVYDLEENALMVCSSYQFTAKIQVGFGSFVKS